MGLFEKTFTEVNSYYEKAHCTTKKDCPFQFLRFNSFLGKVRYCCSLKSDMFQNCDENCKGTIKEE